MAREKSNKSESIREHLTANPDSKAKDVVEALAAKGVKVTEGLVYAVKGGMRERKQRKARVVRAAKAATVGRNGSSVSNADAISLIREVKALAQRAGGFEQLKQLVDALAE